MKSNSQSLGRRAVGELPAPRDDARLGRSQSPLGGSPATPAREPAR